MAARPAATAPKAMPLAPAALVTWTGIEVVGLGPVLPEVVPTDTGVVAGGAGVRVLAGGTTTEAGVEMAYVEVLMIGRVSVVGVETLYTLDPEVITVGVAQYEVVVPIVMTAVVPGRVLV